MSGPIALIGGGEFLPGAEEMDDLLVRAAGGPGIPIVILPTAAAHERPDLAAANGAAYFKRLGYEARPAMVVDRVTANDLELAAEIATARFIYLTGGDPGTLYQVLRYSATWDAIQQARREQQALVAGSSAGAMVLGPVFWNPRPQRLETGLNLLPGLAVAPHHGPQPTPSGEQLARQLPPGVTLLGIPEKTAAAWDGQSWTVLGVGPVVVYRSERPEVVATDETIENLPGPASEAS